MNWVSGGGIKRASLYHGTKKEARAFHLAVPLPASKQALNIQPSLNHSPLQTQPRGKVALGPSNDLNLLLHEMEKRPRHQKRGAAATAAATGILHGPSSGPAQHASQRLAGARASKDLASLEQNEPAKSFAPSASAPSLLQAVMAAKRPRQPLGAGMPKAEPREMKVELLAGQRGPSGLKRKR